MVDENRKQWNARQKQLKVFLGDSKRFHQAVELLLEQHAMVHTEKIVTPGLWSFEDALFDDATDEMVRNIFKGTDYSIAWRIWHIARIEDMTMNILVAGESQVLGTGDWLRRMNAGAKDSGNAMDRTEVAAFSNNINIVEMRAYRLAGGQKTREIIQRLTPTDMARKTDSRRLQRILDEGAVVPQARGLIDYWGGRTIAGLMLMPATRHNLVHLNESFRIIAR